MTITNPSRQVVANPGAYEFGTADRLRKTLTVNGVSVEDAAGMFGVTRHTIGNWINGRVNPDKRTLMLWAISFSVPLEWLETGEWPQAQKKAPSEDGADVRPKGFEPPTFWLGVGETHERGTSSVTELSNGVAGLGLLLVLALRAVRA